MGVVQSNRVLPLHRTAEQERLLPHAAIQSITMGIRFGASKYAIGYIHQFNFSMSRDVKPVYQIEPYMNILGDSVNAAGVGSTFENIEFNEDTPYYPGEMIEMIPGKMQPISLNLSRYSLYTGNLMAAVMRSTGGGVFDDEAKAPNLQEGDAVPKPAIEYVNILQQSRPFDIYQIFVSPTNGKVIWGRKFGGCWFTEIGEEVPDSDQNAPILENGTVSVTYVRPLTSSLPD